MSETGTLLTFDDVMPLVGECKHLAQQLLSRESNAQSVSPTMLMLTALRRQRRREQDWEDVSWDNQKQFFAYMHRAMRQAIIDRARKRSRRPLRFQSLVDINVGTLIQKANDDPGLAETVCTALDALSQLYPDEAQMLHHRYFNGLSESEVARLMKLPKTTTQRRLVAAHDRLREQLQILGVSADDRSNKPC